MSTTFALLKRGRFSNIPLAILGLSFFHNADAQNGSGTNGSIVINLDATTYGDPGYGLPTYTVDLLPGIYRFTPVNPQLDSRASYTAWCPWSPPTQAWDTQVNFRSASGNVSGVIGEDADFSTPELAFNDPLNVPVIVRLATADTLKFYFPDNYLNDNQGGASLKIQLVTQPGIKTIQVANGTTVLVVTGEVAASYSVVATTNLSDPHWETIFTTNAPGLPLTCVDPSSGYSQRFYRVQMIP